MTEKEKMLAGEYYNAYDPCLTADRLRARRLLYDFNHSRPDEEERRRALLEELFGGDTGCFIEPPFQCDYGYNIRLGRHFYANFGCVILDVNRVTIGDNVKFGPSVQVYSATHPVNAEERISGKEMGYPIVIGDNVWIGGGVVICPGITIGNNTTIGAGSVVTRDIPANVVAAGNPCRVIRKAES